MKNTSKKQNLQEQLGTVAEVKRETLESSDETRLAAAAMRSLGESLKPVKELDYQGSLAVHVYKSEILGIIYFVTQTPVGTMAEETAAAAIKDLTGAAMTYYGGKRQTNRRGF